MYQAGQNLNITGVKFFFNVALRQREYALPHISVPDIRHLKWAELKKAGFKGCIIDKDNTLCEPYGQQIAKCLTNSVEELKQVFEHNVAIFSNSAGLSQFDPQGHEADRLEAQFKIPVLRHKEKKPGGGFEDLQAFFGCSAPELVMIGDRYLTDIAFGNKLGMLTVYVHPLTADGEPPSVVLVSVNAFA